MGGETIQGILSRAPWTLTDSRCLLLQPQSKQEELRLWLYENGCGIRSEHLVVDSGKFYPILLAGGPVDRPPTPGELHMGRWPEERRDELFYSYLEQRIEKLERAAAGLARTQKQGGEARLSHLRTQLDELRSWRR